MLVRIHRRHPDDFWVNRSLGYEKPNAVDEVRFSTAAVAIRPANAGARALGSALAGVMKRFDDAIAAYDEALRIRKDLPQAHRELGNALYEKGRLEPAISEYREAIRLETKYADAHRDLGRALEKQDRIREAIASYEEAIRLTRGKHKHAVQRTPRPGPQ